MKISMIDVVAAMAFFASTAHAQPATPASTRQAAFELQAYGINGERFNGNKIRGKVAIVFYWSTTCAVCRDSLPELRANLAGWRNKPFALVTVNVDRNAGDWLAYEQLLSKLQVPPNGLIALHQDDGRPLPSKLPLTLLIDANGKVASRYEGRMAPEAWDGVADLLP